MTGVANLPRVAFWLVPRLADRRKLQEIICGLAQRFAAPPFVPHVTIFSCRRTQRQRELSVLAGLVSRCPSMVMRARGLACSSRLSQALIVELEESVALSDLSTALQSEIGSAESCRLVPHLSLLYQQLTEADRAQLVRETPVVMQEVRFDEVWAVAIPERLTTLDDFYGWQPLQICRLDS